MSSIILIRRSKGLTNFGLPKTVHTRRTSKPPSKRNMPPYSFRFSPSYSLLPHPSSFISPLYPNYPPVGPTRHPPFHLSPSLPVPTNPPPVPSATVQGSQPPRPLFLHRGAGWGSGAGAGSGKSDHPQVPAPSSPPPPPARIRCSWLHGRTKAGLRRGAGEDGADMQGESEASGARAEARDWCGGLGGGGSSPAYGPRRGRAGVEQRRAGSGWRNGRGASSR
jgi:hypothetical protein